MKLYALARAEISALSIRNEGWTVREMKVSREVGESKSMALHRSDAGKMSRATDTASGG